MIRLDEPGRQTLRQAGMLSAWIVVGVLCGLGLVIGDLVVGRILLACHP